MPTVTGAGRAADAVDAADAHELVARTKRYALTVLAPAALATDRGQVSRDTIDDLRELGILNHLAPAAYGGAGLSRYADRRLHELLSYADLNVWLIWAQHAPTVARIAKTVKDPHPLLERALRGQALIGAALSDVRRYPRGHLAATRTTGGWVIDGTISWFSGWGLNDVALIAAVDATSERVVLALAGLDEHFHASPLDLRAVYGSRTERVGVRGAFIPDDLVLAVQTLPQWQNEDRSMASNAGAHFFGLGRRILDELAAEPAAAAVSEAWAPRLSQLRAQAYELTDAVLDTKNPDAHLDERLSLKIRATETLATLSRALLIARAGRGLPAGDTAQLHARSALFLQVQGQTRAMRAAQLERIAQEGRSR